MDLFDIAVASKLAGGGGVTPTGNINITSTAQTDVSAYATAQVVDADLVASNIKKDVDILGVVGTYEGGGGGSSNVVTGEFTTNEAYGVQEITIPYSGNGYPISICIMSKSLDIGSASNVNPTAAICIQKKDSTVAPKYTETSDDEVDMYEINRYSAMYKTRLFYAETLGSVNFFSQNDTTQTAWTRVRMSAKNKLKIFTTGSGENRNGFLSDATYIYTIEYSE